MKIFCFLLPPPPLEFAGITVYLDRWSYPHQLYKTSSRASLVVHSGLSATFATVKNLFQEPSSDFAYSASLVPVFELTIDISMPPNKTEGCLSTSSKARGERDQKPALLGNSNPPGVKPTHDIHQRPRIAVRLHAPHVLNNPLPLILPYYHLLALGDFTHETEYTA